MARNPLGIKCAEGPFHQFLYLDLGKEYYSFHEAELFIIDEDTISDDELSIGTKVLVEWSDK